MDPLIYVYGVGGVVFAIGIAYGVRQGYLSLSGRGLRNLLLLLGVFAFFLAIQTTLQYASMRTAPAGVYTGGAEHVLDVETGARGAPIDYAIMIGYFVVILGIGMWFGRGQKTTKDFFFGGQRFSWWLIAFSLIATTIGSYSFVKYSNMGFSDGLSSSQTYLNDWVWLPLLIFGWLPLLYFSRITSIPEYFGRRFGTAARLCATACLLVYLIGYVGVNLYTMGKVLHLLLGIHIWLAAVLVAAVSTTYVVAGGQTSVIMTDLFQGVMLLLAGVLILVLGISYFGGLDDFWTNLPRDHRRAFPHFNENPDFPAVGIFWQDAIANSAMFYLINQGIIMRFLAAKSVGESRKAALATVVILMTIGALVVGGGGWVARALVHSGALPETVTAETAFYVATEFLSRPGIFGLILAALTAALMSTVDTLITAVSAIAVNDVYKPHVNPKADERQLLKVARWCALSVTVLGVLLVPVFIEFKSIYAAHAAFTASVTPPMVVALLAAVFWRRFTKAAALATMIGGMAAIALSLFIPEIITPFAHGVPMKEVDESSIFAGMKQYVFMRACFGMGVCALIAIVVTLFTTPEPWERQKGLVWGTVADAIRRYKGSPGREHDVVRATALARAADTEPEPSGEARLATVRLSASLAKDLSAKVGDLIYVSDRRRWLGGLHSTHGVVGEIFEDTDKAMIELGPHTYALVVKKGRQDRPVIVERLY